MATLPILACYLSEPYDPSPYAPVSQRFWNELYLDVAATPELAASARARRAARRTRHGAAAVEELRAAPLFDHRRRYELVRPVLDELAATCLSGPAAARADFDRWVSGHPDAAPLRRLPGRHRPHRQRVARTGTSGPVASPAARTAAARPPPTSGPSGR